MKRFFLFLMFASLIAGLYATPSNKYQLVVRTTSGDTAFVLSQQPEISFTEKDIVVSNKETSITIPKTEFIEFLFTPSQYEINFYDWDGTLLQSSMVNYGEWPTYYNSDPWRESDAQYTYTFTGWSPELSVVTGNQSYTAQYEATLNHYEIIFLNWDGEVLQSTMVDYGAMPEYFGVTPTKPEDDQYVYTFSGWEPEITIVVAYAEYTAQYDATDKVTTVIENTQSDEVKTYKILRNNKIFIIRGDKVYSILGNVIEDWMPLGL